MTDARKLWEAIQSAMYSGKEAYANDRSSASSDDRLECAIIYGCERWRDVPDDVRSILMEAWREGYNIEKRYYF